jgi:hypothetical protein
MIRKKTGRMGDWGKRRGLMMKRQVRDKEKHIYGTGYFVMQVVLKYVVFIIILRYNLLPWIKP